MANIFGTTASDTLTGTPEADLIFADAGNDLLNGNQGTDIINGNQGNDTLSGGEGNDLVRGGKDNDQLTGDAGSDILFGDLGNDLIFGNANEDIINGNIGNDTIFGGSGNDLVRGGKDNDAISGDIGSDLLYGDRGIDTLTGGDSNDTFFFQKGIGGASIAEADIITDFVNGTDLIGLLEGLTFASLNIFQGTGANVADTVIQDNTNSQFLAVLQGVNRSAIDPTDFVAPGTLAFSAPTFRVNEDGTPVTAVTVTRTDGADTAVSITVTPSNVTATAPADYNNTPVVVNFAAGDSAPKTVTIPIVNDTLAELTERINLTLSNPTGNATIGTQNTAVVEIVDSDSQSIPRLTFLNPTPEFNDQFGNSVAAVGNNILIGASSDNTGAPGAGAAYLFDGTTGGLLRTFLNPTPESFDRFGSSVAAVGNNILIGALYDNTGARSAGAAYLFDGTTGGLLRTFLNPTPETSDLFGNSVAAVGNNILIGAFLDDTGAPDAGAAYLFDGTTGGLLRTFLNPTPETSDLFGNSVAAVGNNILIGAFLDDTGAPDAGAAYLFDGTTGGLLRTFLNPTPETFDQFGDSVAAVGNNILIGAPSDDTGANRAGAAYLFDGTTGGLLRTFLNPTPEFFDQFGNSVAAVGNNILIGALYDNTGAEYAGAAYLFDGTTGGLLRTFLNPTPESGDLFGDSVAAVGNNILIGAFNDNTGAPRAGAVYLF